MKARNKDRVTFLLTVSQGLGVNLTCAVKGLMGAALFTDNAPKFRKT